MTDLAALRRIQQGQLDCVLNVSWTQAQTTYQFTDQRLNDDSAVILLPANFNGARALANSVALYVSISDGTATINNLRPISFPIEIKAVILGAPQTGRLTI